MSLRDNWQIIQGSIEGWLEGGALEPLCQIDEVQQNFGVLGNLCEIGLHHGKLLVSLSHLARHDEVVVGVDVFEDQNLNENHGDCCGSRHMVVSNMEAYGADRELKLIQADSLTLSSNARFNDSAPYRMFSIDGSHTERHALNDLIVASRVLSPGGVILLDDFRHPAWPGVEQGFDLFSVISPSLAPYLLTASKLFLTTPGHHDDYIAAWRGRGQLERMYGYDVVVC